MKHYNYMVTIGDEELTNKLLSVRSREEKDIEQLSLASFKSKILSELSLCECLLVTRQWREISTSVKNACSDL